MQSRTRFRGRRFVRQHGTRRERLPPVSLGFLPAFRSKESSSLWEDCRCLRTLETSSALLAKAFCTSSSSHPVRYTNSDLLERILGHESRERSCASAPRFSHF